MAKEILGEIIWSSVLLNENSSMEILIFMSNRDNLSAILLFNIEI